MYITEELNELRALDDYDFDSKKVFSNYENRKDAADFTTCIEQMTNEFAEFVSDLIRVKNVFSKRQIKDVFLPKGIWCIIKSKQVHRLN